VTILEVRTEPTPTLPTGVRLALAGELDISSAPTLERELRRAEDAAPPVLVLDLRELTFMDSTGLRLVLGADARARKEGRRLAIVRGGEAIDRVFRIAIPDDRLEMVDDPAEIPSD
jgi:anti-sigma B factor antagonist